MTAATDKRINMGNLWSQQNRAVSGVDKNKWTRLFLVGMGRLLYKLWQLSLPHSSGFIKLHTVWLAFRNGAMYYYFPIPSFCL